jgi:hypothetical protein
MVELVDISNTGIRQSYDLTAGMRDHMTVQPPPSTIPQNSPLVAPPSNPEKNTLSEVEMNLSTPIEEVLDTPMGMMNPQVGLQQPNMVDARSVQEHPARPVEAIPRKTEPSKNPLNLNDDQLLALLAGVAAVSAYSKPVQSKLGELMPTAFGMDGHLSTTGLALTAFIAAVVFYILKNFVVKR